LNRRVRFTATAQDHVRREHAWWVANRDYPDVFADEVERALEIVSRLPGAGSPYMPSPIPGVRRVYLRRTSLHVYYTFDDNEVLIRAVWGARLEHGPDISSDPV
jgi:plasmid stabilization system protein ParE